MASIKDKEAQDEVASADDEARAKAKEKMQAAIKAQGEDIVTGQATLETDLEKRTSSTKADPKKKTKKGAIDTTILTNVKVYSPYHVYYDKDADSVSAENLTGPFDILPGHKNFMSLLTPSEIIIRSTRGEERIKSDRAVMHVRNNNVTIFLDV
jgi:hypothetical protein